MPRLRRGGVRAVSFQAEAFAFQPDDPAFGFYLASDLVGRLQGGDVNGVGAMVLQLAAADVLVEQDRSTPDRVSCGR